MIKLRFYTGLQLRSNTMIQLTRREKEIITLVGEGLSNQKIANQLVVTRNTIKGHIKQIYRKLEVKNREEAIAKAILEGLIPSPNKAIPQNLPVQGTSFIGRLDELKQIDDLVGDSATKLITILGAGGIGKTRLALAVADRYRHRPDIFTDGLYFISLVSLDQPDQIIPAMAKTVGLHLDESGKGGETIETQLINFLTEKKMLLILDNIEHLVEGTDFLSNLLKSTSGITIITTSRERLRLYGEQTVRLPGLAYPKADELTELSLAQFAKIPAVSLFLRTVKRLHHKFELKQEMWEPIRKICHFVDGMPLGVELAAGAVSTQTIEQVAREIEENFDLLQTDLRDVPVRHRSTLAVFESMRHGLSAKEQKMFDRLSVFRGPFDKQAAQIVGGESAKTFTTLIEKSLIHTLGPNRYTLHELLRQFGDRELQTDENGSKVTQERHSNYYCDFLAQVTPDLFGDNQYRALYQIEDNFENIQVAWLWRIKNETYANLEQSLTGLGHFCSWRGRFNDGLRLFGHFEKQHSVSNEDVPLVAHGLAWLAFFNSIQGNQTKANQLIEQARVILHRANSPSADTARGFVLYTRGRIQFGQNSQKTLADYQSSLDLFESANDLWGVAKATFRLGQTYHDQGDFQSAMKQYSRSLEIREQLGERRGRAQLLDWMSNTAAYRGDLVEAIGLAQESLALCRTLDEPVILVNSLGRLGANLAWAGKYNEAHSLQTESLQLYEKLGNQLELPRAHTRLSVTNLATGEGAEAKKNAEKSIMLARRVNDQTVIGWALWVLGQYELLDQGNLAGAHHLFEECVKVNQEIDQRSEMCWGMGMLAYTTHLQGQPKVAGHLFSDTLKQALDIKDFLGLIQGLLTLSFWLPAVGEIERSISLYALAMRHPVLGNFAPLRTYSENHLLSFGKNLAPDRFDELLNAGTQADLWESAIETVELMPRLIDRLE